MQQIAVRRDESAVPVTQREVWLATVVQLDGEPSEVRASPLALEKGPRLPGTVATRRGCLAHNPPGVPGSKAFGMTSGRAAGPTHDLAAFRIHTGGRIAARKQANEQST